MVSTATGIIITRATKDETNFAEGVIKQLIRDYKVVLIDTKRPAKKYWKTVIPETENPIRSVSFVDNKLIVSYLKDANTKVYLFDIKTAKPNKGSFLEFKRTLLKWSAAILTKNPSINVNSLIAIPYNPYFPKPYSRWTMAGMLDLENELKVAEEFWDFLGGRESYERLLNTFEEVGKELRDEIDEFFRRFNETRRVGG